MKQHNSLLAMFAAVLLSAFSAQPTPAQQAPSLVADASHNAPAMRGANAQSFQIGLNLFEGRLEGDVLKGTVRFGGIDFRLPDGSTPRPLYFEFKRVRK